jgi:hypothetical protein
MSDERSPVRGCVCGHRCYEYSPTHKPTLGTNLASPLPRERLWSPSTQATFGGAGYSALKRSKDLLEDEEYIRSVKKEYLKQSAETALLAYRTETERAKEREDRRALELELELEKERARRWKHELELEAERKSEIARLELEIAELR